MQRTLSILLFAVLTLSGRAFAAPEATSNISIKSAVVTISGNSTMHPYTASTKTLNVIGGVATAADLKELLQPGSLQGLELQIPISTFISDKDGLTKQMAKALKADKYPVMAFKLTGYTVEPNATGLTVKPTGLLTVAGVEKPFDIAFDMKELAGVLHARGTRDLLMTDFGIKPPTMFMGMLKTHDKVVVTIELQLALAPKASN